MKTHRVVDHIWRAAGSLDLGPSVPVIHIASMARSGETLLLRLLSAHPHIRVTHDLLEKNSHQEERLFRHLRQTGAKNLPRCHPFLRHLDRRNLKLLILKQGVWSPQHMWRGLILIRSPHATWASLRDYDQRYHPDMSKEACWEKFRLPKIKTWFKDMFKDTQWQWNQQSPVEQFCEFYSLRAKQLFSGQHAILRFEDLIRQPKESIRSVIKGLGLEHHQSCFGRSRQAAGQTRGHGGTNLTATINHNTLERYRSTLSTNELTTITERCRSSAQLFGYACNGQGTDIVATHHRRDISNLRPKTLLKIPPVSSRQP